MQTQDLNARGNIYTSCSSSMAEIRRTTFTLWTPWGMTQMLSLLHKTGLDAVARTALQFHSLMRLLRPTCREGKHIAGRVCPAHTNTRCRKDVCVSCTPQVLVTVGLKHEHTEYTTKAIKADSWMKCPVFSITSLQERMDHVRGNFHSRDRSCTCRCLS